MDARITSIENLIASDPCGRDIFGLVTAGQLRLAAESLRRAKRVAIVSGFYIAEAGAGETDGPPGAKALGQALCRLDISVDYITDELNAPLFRALGIDPIVDADEYLNRAAPTHLISIERAGRASDGRYRNLRGRDITDTTAPLDDLFPEAQRKGIVTIGIGDGGNEIGMGLVFSDLLELDTEAPGAFNALPRQAQCVVATDCCIAAGVSNWGAYGLVGALSILEGRDLLPAPSDILIDLNQIVDSGGAVDGITHRREVTVDSLDLAASLGMLESIRRQLAPSLLSSHRSLQVGIVGYGESGRAAAALLTRHGHRLRISDEGPVRLDPEMRDVAVESGGHSIEFLGRCDLVVASPGVRSDQPIFGELHRRSIAIMSELELAFQLGRLNPGEKPLTYKTATATSIGEENQRPLIAVTGTIGKRTTVELMQQLFSLAGQPLVIGGNRGQPLSELLLDDSASTPIALAVSSFQLESVVHFRPTIAVILNVHDAHLDRHRSVAEYTRIKSRIFMNHGRHNVLILPFDEPRLRRLARKHRGRTLFTSSRQSIDRGAWLIDGTLWINMEGTPQLIGPAAPRYPENLLATILTAQLCGIATEQIVSTCHDLGVTGSTT